MYIVALTYVKPIEDIDPLMPAHMAWLAEHYARGRFLASGRKVPRSGGVILVAKMARADLDAIIAADPFHQNGVARFDITEVEISKAADQLQGLIGA
jgi:uncharacterized protein YciI